MGDIITRGYLHCIDMYYNMHVYHHKHGITCENKVKNHSIFMVFGPYFSYRNGISKMPLLFVETSSKNLRMYILNLCVCFFFTNKKFSPP